MHAIAFDVGQGMAILVETANHRLLYDTGPAYTPEANGGNRTVPTLLYPDGSTQTNPSLAQVKEKLSELASASA